MDSFLPGRRYTYKEYVELEKAADIRHEYFDGQVYAMSGGTPRHAAICANITISLGRQLRGRGCQVYSSDLRVRVRETGLATYPDVTVVCDRLEIDDDGLSALNPCMIVEVLSPSTAKYDRGEKLAHYQRIPSLYEIILVAHDERLLELWRRAGPDRWMRSEHRSGMLILNSAQSRLTVDEVFHDELAPTESQSGSP